jgi:glutamyl-tRNA synthetase
MDRVHKGGAKFDFEKAKWFNHEWIKHQSAELLLNDVKAILLKHQVEVSSDEALFTIISLVKDRCTLLGDFYTQSVYFFESPKSIEIEAIQPKWNDDKKNFFIKIQSLFNDISDWNMNEIETCFKQLATEMNIKVGELQLPFRIMLVGGKFGPGVFQIAEMIGKENTIERINTTLNLL